MLLVDLRQMHSEMMFILHVLLAVRSYESREVLRDVLIKLFMINLNATHDRMQTFDDRRASQQRLNRCSASFAEISFSNNCINEACEDW